MENDNTCFTQQHDLKAATCCTTTYLLNGSLLFISSRVLNSPCELSLVLMTWQLRWLGIGQTMGHIHFSQLVTTKSYIQPIGPHLCDICFFTSWHILKVCFTKTQSVNIFISFFLRVTGLFTSPWATNIQGHLAQFRPPKTIRSPAGWVSGRNRNIESRPATSLWYVPVVSRHHNGNWNTEIWCTGIFPGSWPNKCVLI